MDPLKGKTAGNSGPSTVCTKQQRIANLAKQSPKMTFTTLAHHMDLEWLREAYRRTRKDGGVGVDGQTAADYAANLEENFRSLLERAKSGRYKAPPVRRVHIPKGSGPATRKAASSRPYSPTCSCTKCWTSGLSTWSDRVCEGHAPWFAMRTTRSWCSRARAM